MTHFRKFAGLIVAALAGAGALPAQINDDHPGLQATEKLVVMIEGSFGKGAGVVFAVENGQAYIATMFHVVRKQGAQGADDLRAQNLKVHFRQRERDAVDAKHYEEASFEHDLAVIRAPVAGLSFDFFRLGDLRLLKKGDFAYAVGQPEGEKWGVTYQPGSISAVGAIWVKMQSAYVVPGHSGGALMDKDGRIIGLVKQTGGSTPQALRIDCVISPFRSPFSSESDQSSHDSDQVFGAERRWCFDCDGGDRIRQGFLAVFSSGAKRRQALGNAGKGLGKGSGAPFPAQYGRVRRAP